MNDKHRYTRQLPCKLCGVSAWQPVWSAMQWRRSSFPLYSGWTSDHSTKTDLKDRTFLFLFSHNDPFRFWMPYSSVASNKSNNFSFGKYACAKEQNRESPTVWPTPHCSTIPDTTSLCPNTWACVVNCHIKNWVRIKWTLRSAREAFTSHDKYKRLGDGFLGYGLCDASKWLNWSSFFQLSSTVLGVVRNFRSFLKSVFPKNLLGLPPSPWLSYKKKFDGHPNVYVY